jgi:hypothetical protein
MPKYAPFPVKATRARLKENESPYTVLKEATKDGGLILREVFRKKNEWEERNKKEYYLWVTFDLRYQDKTTKQNNSVWVLIEAIWSSMEKEPPTEEEKYSLYLDLLEVYAEKVKNKITGELRPVHISEADSMEGAKFIDGLLYHLSTMCELKYGGDVVDVLHQWEEWRGSLEADPIDYADRECTRLLTEAEWRERRRFSEASGQGGQIVLAHIVSRGSDAADIDKAWNWLALTHEEHMLQHRIGWEEFLRIFSHLKGRVDRARRLAHKPELDFKRDQQANEYKQKNLAMEEV